MIHKVCLQEDLQTLNVEFGIAHISVQGDDPPGDLEVWWGVCLFLSELKLLDHDGEYSRMW